MASAIVIFASVVGVSQEAAKDAPKPDATVLASNVVELKRSYEETRINGFLKLHQTHLQELEKVLAARLKAGDLPGSNLVNEEIGRVKSRVEALEKGEPIPVPKAGASDSDERTFPQFEAALADHRTALQLGVNQLNRRFLEQLEAAQRESMVKGNLANANAIEKLKIAALNEISQPEATGSAAPKESRTLEGIDLLGPDRRESWVEDRGTWTFQGATLKGSGDSRIVYRESLRPPFTLAFDLNVEKGSRPRVYVGRYVIGNDGYNFQLVLHPRDTKQKAFPYKNGEKVPVRLVVDRRFVELHIGDELVERREPGFDRPLEEIAFSGGDGWSPGITEFSNIRLIR